MKFIFFKRDLLVGIFLIAFLGSCNIQKSATISDSAIAYQSNLSDEELFEFKYQFFEANKYFLEGNYDMATSIFNSCLKIDTYSSASYYKLASIYLYKKDLITAEIYAEKACLYSPNNIWYLYLAGSIYSQNNNIAKAKEAFTKLIELDENEVDFYLNLADVYLKDNDLLGAIKVYSLVETKFGVSESISLQKSKLYIALNDKKLALETLMILSKTDPSNVDYRRMIADFQLQNNNIDDAIIEYNSIVKNFPDDGYSHIGLAECYRKLGKTDLLISELEYAFHSSNLPSDVKFNMLLAVIQSAGNDETIQKAAYNLTLTLYKLYPDDPDISTIYANFLLQKNLLNEARVVLMDVIKIRKDKYTIWEQLVLLDNQFESWDTMFMHTNEALKYFPNQSFLYFFNGFSSFQIGNYEHAVKNLQFGLKLVTNKDPLYFDFMTFLAEAHHKIGDVKKCYGLFDSVLKEQPDNIMVLNNYAYYLSEDNINLDKAEKMSKITITREPNNATYLDTYAWILFKLARYSDALIYIKKAIDSDTDISDVVLEHYGDILFYNNDIDAAVVQWKKALEIGKGSGLLDQKILNKSYIESL